MESKLTRARVLVAILACGALLMGLATTAHAALRTHGALLHIAKPHTSLQAAQSNNWFGYNQGTLEQGSKLFNSITGDWTVPTATQHTAGQDEASSDWIGIGGGCIDAGCTVGDNTLIQTGTEQDITGGKASYSAWWELVPAPSLNISNITVHPGDHMHAAITEVVPNANLWKITLQNVTTGQSFSTTVPYASTHATAEWIEETPLTIGTSGAGLAALPNLTNVPFTNATTNGANANLKSSEEIQLVDSNGKVIGTPSAPNSTADGFTACAWATSC
ncbi:MAG TPA: G1 family glutamic endopeptidase [Thermoleophilaceae bacterium]